MRASDLFVKALEHEGVEYIFGIPGEENLDFLDSLRGSSIQLVLVRHEQAAGFMAATYGRLTGKPGVCLSTLGPGATNFMTPAAFALLGAMPMVILTGQKPILHSKQGRFQIVDVVEMMKPVTKYAKQLVDPQGIPAHVREAFRLAIEERPGPVHLELPEDIAAADTDETFLFPRGRTRRPAAEEKAVRQAAAMIRAAKRPLLLIGAGANRKLTSKMLARFVDETGIPFFNTQMGKGVLDERHARFLGTAALSSRDYLHQAIDHADLIINVGHDVVEKPPFFMRPGGQEVIHVNFFTAAVDTVYFPQLEVVGDIANAIWQLCEALERQEHWDFGFFEKVKAEVEAHTSKSGDAPDFPIKPQTLVAMTRRVMPADGILGLDNGMYKIWYARNYKCYRPNTLLLDNALATMGAGLPSAMAAKLVYPNRKVMAICGDGGFMMNSQELETAVRLGQDIVVMVLNDSAYGMIRWKQHAQGLADWGLTFGNPDFVKYAEAYGAHGLRVTRREDLEPMLREALDTPGVHLVEVPIDYSENQKFTQELQDFSDRLTP